MACYKFYNYNQPKFIPVGFSSQILPGAKRDCLPCTLGKQRLRKPEKTIARQNSFFKNGIEQIGILYTNIMRNKIDKKARRQQYSKRISTLEPLCANICKAIGIHGFSLPIKKGGYAMETGLPIPYACTKNIDMAKLKNCKGLWNITNHLA